MTADTTAIMTTAEQVEVAAYRNTSPGDDGAPWVPEPVGRFRWRTAPRHRSGRPEMDADAAEVYDTWLTPNGISGWLPIHPVVTLHRRRRITFPEWRHEDGTGVGWGDDLVLDDDAVRPRTVRLLVPLTDRIRELATREGMVLIDRRHLNPLATAGRRRPRRWRRSGRR